MVEAKTKSRGLRKRRTGVVVSKSGDKSIVVEVVRKYQHPLYKKYITKHSKCHAHDEKNEAKLGDKVKIIETKPVSKMKKWRVVEVIAKKSEAI